MSSRIPSTTSRRLAGRSSPDSAWASSDLFARSLQTRSLPPYDLGTVLLSSGFADAAAELSGTSEPEIFQRPQAVSLRQAKIKKAGTAVARKQHGLVTLERDGRRYVGAWSVKKGMMTVELRGIGSDITQVGGHANNPDNLAMVILSEMITKHLQKSVGH